VAGAPSCSFPATGKFLTFCAAHDFNLVAPKLPDFDIPAGHTEMSWLRELTLRGARERYGPPQAHPKAYAQLEGELHRTPTEAEVAEHMGIALNDLHNIFSQVSFVNVVALDELLSVGGEKGDKLSLVDTLEDTKAEDPVAAFETEETKYLLAKAINTLPEREKIVVTLYYYEGLTLAEIGQVLGVTESRVCQIHTKSVIHLRAKIAAGEREPA
jgi:RNA polymerase sigma factor (sigma-70 family)